MKPLIKKIVPTKLWEWMRANRFWILDVLTSFNTKLCRRAYHGYALYYSPGMAIVDRIRGGATFEPELGAALVDSLASTDDAVMLDIGANIGLMSLYVLSHTAHARIVAFEPGPHQGALLKKTIEANNLADRLELHTEAVSDAVGTASFHTHASRDVAKDGFIDTGRASDPEAIEVTTTTLDTWWASAGKPKISVIKMDTEGSELLILRGAKALLLTHHPVVFLEIHDSNLKAYSLTAEDILSFFEDHGYGVYVLGEAERVTKETIRESMQRTDTYCARSITV